MHGAYNYAIDHGLMLETDYPYQAADLECRADETKFIADHLDSWYSVNPDTTGDNMEGVVSQFGPVSVAVDATNF